MWEHIAKTIGFIVSFLTTPWLGLPLLLSFPLAVFVLFWSLRLWAYWFEYRIQLPPQPGHQPAPEPAKLVTLPASEQIETAYRKRVTTPLCPAHLKAIIGVQLEILALAQGKETALILSCFVDGLVDFTTKVTPHILDVPHERSVFGTTISHSDCVGSHVEQKDGYKYQFASGQYDAFKALALPFSNHHQRLRAVFDYNKFHPQYSEAPQRENYSEKSDFTAADKRHDAYVQGMNDIYDSYDWAVAGTPYWGKAASLLPTGSHREPFIIPEDTFFKSTFIVAPPGRGKTTLLRALFLDRLKLVEKNEASIIILDSKGQFSDEISHATIFARGQPLHDKLILINPDPDHPLALNPLALDPPIPNATDGQKGLAQSRTIELIEYLISVFVSGEQSNPQQRFLRAVIKAVLEVFPNPTFEDLYGLLVNGYEPYEAKISQMEDRSFFSKDQFYGGTVKPTRESLITRIGFMRDNYALGSIIKSRESRLNLATEMDSSTIIVINNGIDLLGDEGCEFFGRFFLFLMRKAAERRRHIPEDQKMPVYVICDEAHNVIKRDDKIARTIQDLRSHKIAMTFAIQDLSEIHSDKVKSALFSCGIIMANTKEDAPALSSRLRVKSTDPLDFINRPTGQFAAYVFGKADDAVALTVDNPHPLPQMTTSEFNEVISNMRDRYCVRTEYRTSPEPPRTDESQPQSKKRRAVPEEPLDFG